MLQLNIRESLQEIASFLGGDLYYHSKVPEQQYKEFKQKINHYLPTLMSQNEDYLVANALTPLLQSLGFSTAIKQKSQGKSEIDLALMQEHNIAVIIEAKKPSNANEMISAEHYNKKALHEVILYYLREKERCLESGARFEIKYIIITDFYRFFIFKESEFERYFYKDEHIKNNLYGKYKSLTKQTDLKIEKIAQKTNEDFYNELKEYLASEHFNAEFRPLYLDLQKVLDSKDLSEIKPFVKAFSPEFLLELYIHKNDINEAFYKELLYILGLKVLDGSKDKNKNTIIPNNVSGTLYHNIIDSLPDEADKTQENIISLIILWLNRILFLKLIEANLVRFNPKQNQSINPHRFLNIRNIKDFQSLENLFFEVFAKPHNERDVSSPFFAMPYLNSSLFNPSKIEQNLIHIRALSNDKQLLPYSEYNKKSKISNVAKIPLLRYLLDFLDSYDFGSGEEYEADTLINASILGNVFERINAYKDGSFYTPSAISAYICEENLQQVVVQRFNEANPKWQCKNIADIEYEIYREIRHARNTNVKSTPPQPLPQGEGLKNAKNSPSLAEGDKGGGLQSVKIKSHNDKNPHNDRESIIEKHIATLKSVKICDPSVGSGHFLVSALNEMIKIYYELGLLDSSILSKELHIIGDELVLSDFTYTKPQSPNEPRHKIQKALFNLKKSIIEHNLFGVDINPNSVDICKLRLWIELLKNSYYLTDSNDGFNENLDSTIHQMQTLPNIDINIKCGNSLISNIDINFSKEKLESQLKALLNKDRKLGESDEEVAEIKSILDDLKIKLPKQIQSYKNATNAYKNETNEDLRGLHKRNIESAKEFILSLFVKTHPAYREFKSTLANYLKSYGYGGIDNATLPNANPKALQEARKNLNDYLIAFNYHKTLGITNEPRGFVERDFIALLDSMRSYESISKEAKSYFEWRFEFPEVLDKNGDFMCFDLIVGNPPYGDLLDKAQKDFCQNKKLPKEQWKYQYADTGDTYKLFIEKGFNLIKQHGNLAYIVPLSITSSKSNIDLHKMLLENCEFIRVSSYGHRPMKVFPNAEQRVSVISFTKTLSPTKHLMTTKINRRYTTQSLKDLIAAMDFTDSLDFVQEGALCKIGLPIEQSIMQKIYAQKQTLKSLMKGKERIYYRDTGGGYYDLYTGYSTTNSTTEKSFKAKNAKMLVALMSSNLFWWFRNAYSEGRHSYTYEFERFSIPKFSKAIITKLEKLATRYESDIEKNHDFSNGVKTYKIRKSKHIIDEIDRLICPLYDLSDEEMDFIINYEIEFRTD
ncbi:type IIG restriction enzyme/methyltransferase [Helicobacter sp. T3_23-1059]